MALPQDPSTLSDEQLLAAINGASSEDVDPPTQRQAPTVDFNEVMRGLTSDETRRAESDSKFAQSILDRHSNFALRTLKGENPLASDTPDAERLWHWQNAYAEKPSLLTVAGEAVKTIANDTGNALAEVTDIALDAGKAALTFDNDLLTKTGQRAADLATVASAKALSVNNTLVRGAGQLATSVATSGDTPSYARAFLGPVMLAHPKLASVVEKAAADTEGREQLEVEQRRLSFENARANFRDEKTAETFHKDIALIFPGVAAVLGNTEVNQSAASGLANIPQMGVEMVVARGAAVAGYSTASANARLAVESLKKMESELVSATTARSAAVRVGDSVAISDAENWVRTLDGDIAVRRGKIGELMSKAQAELDDAMTLATSRVAAATVAQGSGRFISGAGKLAEALDALPADLAAKIAPDSQVVRDNLERAIRFSAGATAGAAVGTAVDSTGTGAVVGGIVAGKGFGGVSARAVTNAGRDLTRLGEIFAVGESTLPFWQNVRKARDISGVTKQAAAFMDNSLFDASAQVAVGAVKGGVAAGAVGAGIGALMSPDDVVSGAVGGFAGGAAFGSTVGALGQWKSYENAAQLAQERAGQLRVYKDLLLARPDEAKHFDKLDNFTQTQIAGYLAAHPDLKVRYLDDPTLPAGNYDGKALPDYITINLASRDPLVDIVAHEVSHYVEHHQLGSALVKQALGDFEAGIPGDYSERDAFGNPVLEMDGTGKGVRYKTNSEFNDRRDAYVERLKATAQRAGWSPEVTAAEVARVSEPDYIAREIFAEQHVAYLNSPTYARDLKGIRAPSDWVNNSAFLKNALAKFGVVFKPDGEIVRSGILGDYSKSATFDGLMREYYRKRAEAKSGDVEFTGGNTNIDEAALTKATGYVERYFDASGEILRDTEGKPIFDANGKAQLRKQADSDKDARGAAEAAVKQLDSAAGVSPDALPTDPDVTPASSAASPEVVQRRKTADGRTVYAGRHLSDETLAAIVASGKLNPTQLDNLRQLNSELKAGFGAEWTHFYQAATKKGGGSRARSLAGRWRTDLVYGIEITQPGNIIFKSISLEVLNDNAARAVQKGEAKLWNNSIADLLADTRTYLKNVADGVPGETGLGIEKKNFLNNLLGLRIKAHGDVNPLYETTNQPKTIITSLRLDRMNRLSPVAERNVPFSAESYQRAARNLRPDAEGQSRPGSAQTETPEFKKWFGKSRTVGEDGKPEVWYHGTKADFTEFKSRFPDDDNLIFFTRNPEFASKWAQDRPAVGRNFTDADFAAAKAEEKAWWKSEVEVSPGGDLLRKDGTPLTDSEQSAFWGESRKRSATAMQDSADASVYPVFLKAEKIFDPSVDGKKLEGFLKTLPNMQGVVERGMHLDGSWAVYESKPVTDWMRSRGYDAVRLRESSAEIGGKMDTLAVFDSTQIKSATGNRGTFDGTNPNIQMRPDGKVERDIGSNADFAKPPTDEAAVNAISSDKKHLFGKARSLPEGTPVGLRIDIPAFERHDVYVVTVHDKATPGDVGDRIGYDTVVRVTDPKFFVKEGDETIKKGAQAIKDGRAKKHPIATVEGAFDPSREIPSDLENWTATGFDPKDHSYFYDKRTDEPVLSGSQAVSVGNTVFVKDPVYGDKKDFRYRPDALPAGEDALRAIDAAGDKKATQVDPKGLKYPENPVTGSVALVPRWGLVNRDIVGMPRSHAEVSDIVTRAVNRLKRVVADHPKFAKDSAAFYLDMGHSSMDMADAIEPGISGTNKYLLAEMQLRNLALGSPRTDVTGNATKSSGSAAAHASGHEPGFKLGFGSQQRGAKETYAAWKRGEHFNIDAEGIDDKVKSFYVNGLSELIDIARADNNQPAVDELLLRAGKSLHLVDESVKALDPKDESEIQRHLDGKATIDMWDMAGKGFAWPGYILSKANRGTPNQQKVPFHWTQEKFAGTSSVGSQTWRRVAKDLGITGPGELRYQQARALRIDGNSDWTEKTWAARKEQPFAPETAFTYFSDKSEAGLSPGGAGPMYDAQQAIDGIIADRLNTEGMAKMFGKDRLTARNAQEILWALEKLDNPLQSNNDLSLYGSTFKSLTAELANLRIGKDVTKKSRAESVLSAMDRAFAQMARQELPIEVVSGGTSDNAVRIQSKIAQLRDAGDTNAVATLTDTVADGLGDQINDFAEKHGLDITVDRVSRGSGGYEEGGNVAVSPNLRLTLRGNPQHVRVALEAMSRAMDQDGGNVMRKPTVRELNDVRVKKNTVLTFDTRHLSEPQRNALFGELSGLTDGAGKRILTGFTETSDGIAIGDQFYSGDMRVELANHKAALGVILGRYNVPQMRVDRLVIDTFTRGTPEVKQDANHAAFSSALRDHIISKIEGAPAPGAPFPQATDARALLTGRTDRGITSLPTLNKTKATALKAKLGSDVDAAVLRGELDVDAAKAIKELLSGTGKVAEELP